MSRTETPARSSAIASESPGPAGRWPGRVAAAACLWMLLSAAAAAQESAPAPLGWLVDAIESRGLWLGLLAVFAGGLALNLTPCVYPMIPVTLAFFSSEAAGSPARARVLALLYVAGLSTSYAALGTVTALAGSLLGAWLQHPLVLLLIAAMIVALALSAFGVYDLQLPPALTRRLGRAPAGMLGAVVMGAMVGLVAAPCVGPFVAGLVLYVAQVGQVLTGFLIFFVLGLGMGAPYVLLAVTAARARRLPKAGPWLVWSKKVLGLVLLGLALYFIRPLLSDALLRAAVVALLAGGGLYIGWLERTRQRGAFIPLRRLLGAGLILAAALALRPVTSMAPGVAWEPYTQTALDRALRAGKPAVIDVYADWCLPCVELDHVTFRHPDVVTAMRPVAALRLDATSEISEEAQALLDRHRVIGVPTVLLFNRQGRERTDLRLTGFEPANAFLQRLRRLDEPAP